MSKKVKKIIKIVLIVLLSLIITLLIAAWAIYQFVIKPNAQQFIAAIDSIIKDEEILAEIRPYLNDEDLYKILGEDAVLPPMTNPQDAPVEDVGQTQTNPTQDANQQNQPASPAQPDSNVLPNTPASPNSPTQKNPTSGNNGQTNKAPTSNSPLTPEQQAVVETKNNYPNQYAYIKDHVDAPDFSRGMELVKRVDLGYVLGLVKNGLTPEEKKELKSYLKERFSSSEIAEGVALYAKYSYLLK